MSDIRLREITREDAPALAGVLEQLPGWFTPEEVETVREVAGPPGVAVVGQSDEVLGFLVWEQRPDEWEICWIGVVPHLHRRGLGKRMFAVLLDRAVAAGASRLRVQTVADTTPDEGYSRTRAFYESLGFTLQSVLTKGWPDGSDKAIYTLSLNRGQTGGTA